MAIVWELIGRCSFILTPTFRDLLLAFLYAGFLDRRTSSFVLFFYFKNFELIIAAMRLSISVLPDSIFLTFLSNSRGF